MEGSQSTFLILTALTPQDIWGGRALSRMTLIESSAVPALMMISVALAWQLNDFHFYYFSHMLEGGKSLVAWIREWLTWCGRALKDTAEKLLLIPYHFLYAIREHSMDEQIVPLSNKITRVIREIWKEKDYMTAKVFYSKGVEVLLFLLTFYSCNCPSHYISPNFRFFHCKMGMPCSIFFYPIEEIQWDNYCMGTCFGNSNVLPQM